MVSRFLRGQTWSLPRVCVYCSITNFYLTGYFFSFWDREDVRNCGGKPFLSLCWTQQDEKLQSHVQGHFRVLCFPWLNNLFHAQYYQVYTRYYTPIYDGRPDCIFLSTYTSQTTCNLSVSLCVCVHVLEDYVHMCVTCKGQQLLLEIFFKNGTVAYFFLRIKAKWFYKLLE